MRVEDALAPQTCTAHKVIYPPRPSQRDVPLQHLRAMRLEQLPRDALLAILVHLTPVDIVRLRSALSSSSPLHALTGDPYLWRFLYFRYFPQRQSIPQFTITADGTIDWWAAYRSAERRRAYINLRRSNGWRDSVTPQTHPPQVASPPPAIRIIADGNIHRIVSDTAERSAANVTWDHHIRAARFDWTGTQPPLSTPPSSPTHSHSPLFRSLPPSPPPSAPPDNPL